MLHIWVICGGPSPERGISLNSARSLLDHLSDHETEIVPFYVDIGKNWYRIKKDQLYSNTPSDFDFKLEGTGGKLTPSEVVARLKKCDIVYPAIHGKYGEDGELQAFLEEHDIPYVWCRTSVCKNLFDKYKFNEALWEKGFATIPTEVLKIYHSDHADIIRNFFEKNAIQQVIVKPASSGSSIGVFSAQSPEEAQEKVELLFSKRIDTRVVIQPFLRWTEFTVIVLQNKYDIPVAILPTEIVLSHAEWMIFDYRKKYLPTRSVSYHCPPRFNDRITERIRIQAEQIFSCFHMRDVVRLDGWVRENGDIYFTDFNPVSGMEQNSFLFQQGSRVGFSHRSFLQYVVWNSMIRQNIWKKIWSHAQKNPKIPIALLMGGDTAERQVSLMSGTNVWLKLRKSGLYEPIPYVFFSENEIYKVPYPLLLNHTIEEIRDACKSASIDEDRITELVRVTQIQLAIPDTLDLEQHTLPITTNLETLTEQYTHIFLALHGGKGENGTLQKFLSEKWILYNGSHEDTSRICMDKWLTSKAIEGIDGVSTAKKISQNTRELFSADLYEYWKTLTQKLKTKKIIVKPQSDGCSAWVVLLQSEDDFVSYTSAVRLGTTTVPAYTFTDQDSPIEMPTVMPEYLLFEVYIETDKIHASGGALRITKKTWWIEVTVGILEDREGILHSLNPSITVAFGGILSVEEKFQWWTGINITPLPEEILPKKRLNLVRQRITEVAKILGIRWYARIDAFIHRETGEVIIIEVNTLPALTPSTVLFHQWLAEDIPLRPEELIERLIPRE